MGAFDLYDEYLYTSLEITEPRCKWNDETEKYEFKERYVRSYKTLRLIRR
jgi:hypothetical protein